jgi:hypothetical protein
MTIVPISLYFSETGNMNGALTSRSMISILSMKSIRVGPLHVSEVEFSHDGILYSLVPSSDGLVDGILHILTHLSRNGDKGEIGLWVESE